MAAAMTSDDEMITGINVTPLVDVVLVLLVILMVTASYVVSRSVPPRAARRRDADAVPSTLVVSLGKEGELSWMVSPSRPRRLKLR
jgi:biopolymer transport protein ExbD